MSSAATSTSAACGRRALLLTAAAAIAGLAVLFGGAGGADATSLMRINTSTEVTISPSTALTTDHVTLGATVTAASGAAPTGSVEFDAQFTAAGTSTTTSTVLGTADLAPGPSGASTASLDLLGLPTGVYQVTGTYSSGGSITWASSTSDPAKTLTIGTVTRYATTMTFTESTPTIIAGQQVTFSTTLSSAPGQPAPTGVVRFSAGDNVSDATTIATAPIVDGTAQATVGGWSGGSYVVVATYDGDGLYLPLSPPLPQVSLTVNPAPSQSVITTTTVTLDPGTVVSGSTVKITAHISQNGNPLPPPAGDLVNFSAGPVGTNPVPITSAQAVPLDANGDAIVTIGGWGAGQYTIVAGYVGNVFDKYSTGSATLSVFDPANAATTTAYTGDTTGGSGEAATLSAHLENAAGPLASQQMTLQMGAESCKATTDASGNASCQITVSEDAGTYPITAAFAGAGLYSASSDTTQSFTVLVRSTTTVAADAQAPAGSSINLSATLTDAGNGQPVSGKTIAIAVGSQSCDGVTDSTGTASCAIVLAQSIGTHAITATFAGDASFTTSTGGATLTVVAPNTTTQAGPVAPVLAGSSSTLSATVTPASATGTVTFASGGTTLCTATLSAGAASCDATFSQPGSFTVTASYGGDSVYPASSGTTTVLVYALAPGGGSFVIGDKNASGSVTFWGAQWSKANALSRAAAPNAFKGFAANAATCGGTWSTDPGNSSPPPAGPLPAYMAVIVTSTATKSGSQISGTIVEVVIVKTDAGYAANSGHAGTGTVVATISCRS